MHSSTLTPEQRQIAEYTRLARAAAQVNDYRLQRIAGTNTFLVSRNGATYRTSEEGCGCLDHQKTGLRCKHMCLVAARLDVEGRVSDEARRAQSLKDRELW